MPVAASTPSITYLGNGATVSFAVPFPLLSNGHILVELLDLSGVLVSTWTAGVNYSYTGSPATAIVATVAPAANRKLRISRVTPKTQSSDFNVNET